MRLLHVCSCLLLITNFSLSLEVKAQARAGQNTCDKGVEACVAEKRQEWADRGTLGAMLHPMKEEDVATAAGARWIVHQVKPGGAAEGAGLLKGDLLTAWNGEAIPPNDLAFVDRRLESLKVGDKVKWTIRRAGESKVLDLTARTCLASQPGPG